MSDDEWPLSQTHQEHQMRPVLHQNGSYANPKNGDQDTHPNNPNNKKHKKHKKKKDAHKKRTKIVELKRIDYVLVFEDQAPEDGDQDELDKFHKRALMRERFEKQMEEEGLDFDRPGEREIIVDNVFIKVHCPFKRLCKEAEKVKLEMPLKEVGGIMMMMMMMMMMIIMMMMTIIKIMLIIIMMVMIIIMMIVILMIIIIIIMIIVKLIIMIIMKIVMMMMIIIIIIIIIIMKMMMFLIIIIIIMIIIKIIIIIIIIMIILIMNCPESDLNSLNSKFRF